MKQQKSNQLNPFLGHILLRKIPRDATSGVVNCFLWGGPDMGVWDLTAPPWYFVVGEYLPTQVRENEAILFHPRISDTSDSFFLGAILCTAPVCMCLLDALICARKVHRPPPPRAAQQIFFPFCSAHTLV
eukprot:GEMP01095319.1.p1 GENE.GEMP01095319.1~~GEMP01095319.1.p1  ORF type:complete len:130 (+),score=6.87 GEMP01095319.1:382-771(+)